MLALDSGWLMVVAALFSVLVLWLQVSNFGLIVTSPIADRFQGLYA